MRLKETLREAREVSFIINRDDVITFYLGQVFHGSYHEYCCKSVAMYMHTRVGQNRTLKALFWYMPIIYND